MTQPPTGRPALGYRLAVDPATAPRVREVFEAIARGDSMYATGKRLGLHATQVRRILNHEQYKAAGPLRIVEPRLWRRAHAQLEKRRPTAR